MINIELVPFTVTCKQSGYRQERPLAHAQPIHRVACAGDALALCYAPPPRSRNPLNRHSRVGGNPAITLIIVH